MSLCWPKDYFKIRLEEDQTYLKQKLSWDQQLRYFLVLGQCGQLYALYVDYQVLSKAIQQLFWYCEDAFLYSYYPFESDTESSPIKETQYKIPSSYWSSRKIYR